MKSHKISIALFVLSAFFVSCKKSNPTDSIPATNSIPIGAFEYNAFDTTGSLILQGWMTLVVQDSAHVTGEWHFTKVGEPKNIGPHYGDGQLVASFYQGLLSANLNPKYADNNVFLRGPYEASMYSGTWMWSGFGGPINRGSFQAIKR